MKKLSANAIMLQARRTWGQVRPATVAFKSKKAYDRHCQDWKKEVD